MCPEFRSKDDVNKTDSEVALNSVNSPTGDNNLALYLSGSLFTNDARQTVFQESRKMCVSTYRHRFSVFVRSREYCAGVRVCFGRSTRGHPFFIWWNKIEKR